MPLRRREVERRAAALRWAVQRRPVVQQRRDGGLRAALRGHREGRGAVPAGRKSNEKTTFEVFFSFLGPRFLKAI